MQTVQAAPKNTALQVDGTNDHVIFGLNLDASNFTPETLVNHGSQGASGYDGEGGRPRGNHPAWGLSANDFDGTGFIATQESTPTPTLTPTSVSGLLGHWSFDERSWAADCLTKDILDSSGNGHHGTACINGDAPFPVPGKFGNAGRFDGIDQYANMGPGFNFTSSFTAAMWIALDDYDWCGPTSKSQHIIGTHHLETPTGYGRGWGIYWDCDGLAWELTNNDGSAIGSYGYVQPSPFPVNGSWHHIALVYDSTVPSATLFWDGASIYSESGIAKVPGFLFNNGEPLTINGLPYAPSAGAPGKIDDTRVYNRVLSGAEIQVLYGNPTPIAVEDAYSTDQSIVLTVPAPGVLGNDTDPDGSPITAIQVGDPANGTLHLNANGSFTYTPAPGFSGRDTFTYRASDGSLQSNVASVSILVNAVPAPGVLSVARASANPSTESSVDFTITFSEPVTGVDATDFILSAMDVIGAAVTNVSGTGAVRTVTTGTGVGIGTIRLDVVDNDSIQNASNDPLGGAGIGNGNFTGETYTIARPANVNVTIGANITNRYHIPENFSQRLSYAGINNGPVKVINTMGNNTIASQRVLFGGVSYSEMMGLPFEQLTNEYLFPYYNNVVMDSQLRVSNLGAVPTTITVYLAGQKIDEYSLAAGGATRKNYTGRNSGPLRVTSSATDILSTIRVLYGDKSYSELMGYPANLLTDEYLFPYYNNVAMNSQLRVSNLGNVPTTITVYLGTQQIDSYSLGAGEATRKNYPNRNSGPLRVTSSATNILSTIRVLYAGSLSELMGFPANQLAQEYWYPVYDNAALDSQLRVSNVGNAPTTITVYVGGAQIDSYTLGAGGASRKNYAHNTGPLQVVSSSQPILSTIRMLYVTPSFASLYEMTGLPDPQLSTQYFFPWYNNNAMDSQLRFAVP